jgi:hypothetical protein
LAVYGIAISGSIERLRGLRYIDIVFDGAPGPARNPGFIEVENAQGESIVAGEWVERSDGGWALRIPLPGDRDEDFRSNLPRSMDGGRLSIMPAYTGAGYFGEANAVTDGERTALYVPLSSTRARGASGPS